MISNNPTMRIATGVRVVNYFQNLYLCDFQQPQFFKKMIFCLLSQDIEKRKPSVPISLENKREGFSFPNIV